MEFMDLMGLNQGNTIISYLNNKDLSCLDLIEYFSSDINVDNISDNELFKQYIYINLLNNSENEKFSQNKLKINELFEQKIDELIDKNIDIKDKYLNYLLINEEDEEKQMEIQLAIENKDYLIIPEELLEIFNDFRFFLEIKVKNYSKEIEEDILKYNNECSINNEEMPKTELEKDYKQAFCEGRWIDISLKYQKLFYQIFLISILIKE